MGDPLDHAKHLRAVHFSLVVVAIVVAITVAIGSGDRFEKAIEEVKTIEILRTRFSDPRDMFDSSLAEAIDNNPDGDQIRRFRQKWSKKQELIIETGDRTVNTIEFSKTVFLSERHLWPDAVGVFPDIAYNVNEDYPSLMVQEMDHIAVLRDFQAAWNAMNHLRDFHAVVDVNVSRAVAPDRKTLRSFAAKQENGERVSDEKKCLIYNESVIPIEVQIDDLDRQKVEARGARLLLAGIVPHDKPLFCRDHSQLGRTWGAPYAIAFPAPALWASATKDPIIDPSEYGFFDPDSAWYRVPVSVVQLNINAQDYYLSGLDKNFRVRTGSFEQSFPSIAGFLEEYNNMSLWDFDIQSNGQELSNLRNAIGDLSKLSSKQINLFGVSAPGSLIASWGSALLAAVMLYLALHIRAFTHSYARPFGPSEILPWIGFYTQEPIAKVIVVVTAVILPVAVSFWLAFGRAASLNDNMILSYAAAGVTLVVGIFLFDALIQLWRSIHPLKRDSELPRDELS